MGVTDDENEVNKTVIHRFAYFKTKIHPRVGLNVYAGACWRESLNRNAGSHVKGKMKAKANLSLIVRLLRTCNAHNGDLMRLEYTYHRCDLLTPTHAFFIP